MQRSTYIEDRDAALLAGDVAPLSSGSTAGPTAEIIPFRIPQKPLTAAALWALEDEASVLDDDVFSLGTLAVNLVGSFQLPRILVWVGGED